MRLCDLLNIDVSHCSRINVSCSKHVDLKLTLIKLDNWCVT